jgi:hypothetical protein
MKRIDLLAFRPSQNAASILSDPLSRLYEQIRKSETDKNTFSRYLKSSLSGHTFCNLDLLVILHRFLKQEASVGKCIFLIFSSRILGFDD